MTVVSIAEAKNHLPRLVQQVEAGEPVRITRRGLPVAVLISEAEYARLVAPRRGIAEFLGAWRREAERVDGFAEGDEFEGLRDNSAGRAAVFE
jgi:prevent-host-death family protein